MTRLTRTLATLALLLGAAVAVPFADPAAAQDRARTKEIVVAFSAEPRTLLPDTIVDWTTNVQLEHIYDRLVDRDPKTYKPMPMLATSWKVVNDTTWEFTLKQGV
ncbi:MAG TPA: ABC transporter substrate-binding protein, partial [Methylomirabilota bacterium]|nr:ABC transporter substrate-binding protein [Methylomirabilota bacterium]